MSSFKRIVSKINIWSVLSFVLIILILLPNLNIFIKLFNPPGQNWEHIKNYLLKDYIINSIILVFLQVYFQLL